jgi:mevalonate kinase
LLGLLEYLEKLNAAGELQEGFDLPRFKDQVIGGLHFQSTIPEAYGAGSSGSLVAAIYDEFGLKKAQFDPHDFPKLRKALAQIESYYHGTSSGIDPLCCYLNKPILFDGDMVYPVNVPASPPGTGFFLLDTGKSGMGPMIEYFKSRLQDPAFHDMIHDHFIPLVERNIDRLLDTDSRLPKGMQKLSEMEYESFRRMIPQDFQRIWKNGLQTGTYSLKLCGSGGGGGYIIGYSSEWIEAMQYFNRPGFRMLLLDT